MVVGDGKQELIDVAQGWGSYPEAAPCPQRASPGGDTPQQPPAPPPCAVAVAAAVGLVIAEQPAQHTQSAAADCAAAERPVRCDDVAAFGSTPPQHAPARVDG